MMGEPILSERQEEGYAWDFESAVASAKKSGFTVVNTSPETLLLDIDDTESKRHFEKAFQILKGHFALSEKERWRSKSGDGWHIVVNCKPCDFTTRVALQACLGSDRKREALALMMAVDGHPEVSLLFRPAQAVSQ